LDKGGLVLQDIVNEFGQRLDFDVEHGLYQGKKTAVGFDGIWRTKNEPELIIGVKTTDYVSLDKLANYRSRLATRGTILPHSPRWAKACALVSSFYKMCIPESKFHNETFA
jgi:hypothetical protein